MPATSEPINTSAPQVEVQKPKRKNSTKVAGEVVKKRGPARPYRKLTQEVLDARLCKLKKRIAKASSQQVEAQGFLEKYAREQDFRQSTPVDS